MELLLALLPILAALIPFILNEIVARRAKAADPMLQNQEAYAQINSDLLSKDSSRITIGSTERLIRLQRLLNSTAGNR
jgi:hypothetical protein